MSIYAPYVIERSSRGERTYDVFSRLLMDRIVFLGTPVTDDVANVIIAQLLFLESDNQERDIHMYINSPGGSVSAGMAIYDTMQYLKSPVNTTCMGMAASMGAFLLMACSKLSNTSAPAPSAITKPSLFISNGLDAAAGFSLFVDSALDALKPPTELSFIGASEPPVMIISALPNRI